jgi:hypothetical protein
MKTKKTNSFDSICMYGASLIKELIARPKPESVNSTLNRSDEVMARRVF